MYIPCTMQALARLLLSPPLKTEAMFVQTEVHHNFYNKENECVYVFVLLFLNSYIQQ